MKSNLFILFFAVLFSAGVSCKKGPYVDKPCQPTDLLGSWKMISMNVTQKPMYGGPLYYTHQERTFHEDGEMQHFVSQTPLTKEMKKTFENAPRTIRYSLDSLSVVTIRVSKRTTDRFRCRVAQNGELVFTWPESGNPTLVHRFKKID